MKILLTGATGFIGSHLARRLLAEHALTCLVPSSELGLRSLPEGTDVRFCDLTDAPRLARTIEETQPQAIVHLAAVTPVRYSFQFPAIYQEVNHEATVNLVQAALKVEGLQRFLFASTMETYGWQAERVPFREDRAQRPASPYAVSKVAAEQYVRMAGRAYGLPYVVLRPCNTYGRSRDDGYVVEYMVSRMLRGEAVYLGSPDAVRDFMYVDDHVEGYARALAFELGDLEERRRRLEEDPDAYVFNVGAGSEMRLLEVAQAIRDELAFRGEIHARFPPGYPARPVVEPYLSLDATKARRDLKWEPRVTLREGLARTIAHWKAAE